MYTKRKWVEENKGSPYKFLSIFIIYLLYSVNIILDGKSFSEHKPIKVIIKKC